MPTWPARGKSGNFPGAGGTQRLLRLVGIGKAKELILTGEIIDAREAWRIGLVNKVVPEGQAVRAAREMAKKILTRGPPADRPAAFLWARHRCCL